MGELSREEFLTHIDYVRSDVQGIHDRLDTLNGRVRKAEQEIAVLTDRGVRTTDSGARWTAGIVGAAGVLMELLHRVWGAK